MNDYEFKDFLRIVQEHGVNWIDENYESYDDFESAFDDMQLDDTVTGNMSGRCTYHDDDIARKIIWRQEFIDYIDEFDTDLGTLVKKGEETIFVYACYMAIDWHLYNYFDNYFAAMKGDL